MADLKAEAFINDPRVKQAQELLLEALRDHQSDLNTTKPADASRMDEYEKTLADFGEIRGGGLFYPYLGSGFGNGPLVELADGSVKYDMITGIGVHVMGHSHEKIIASSMQAALSDTVMQGNLQQNTESADLATRFVKLAQTNGSKLSHCFLTTSGVMSVENALKMIFQHHFPANRVLAFNKCFAGRTMAVGAITDRAKYRDGLPPTLIVDYIPFFDVNDPEGSTQRALDALHGHLKRYPKQHAGMIMELVQGEGGYNVGNRDFFVKIMQVLKEHNIAVFADEIQTFARTTQPFAFQHFGLDEYVDLVTVGKNTQVCATLFKDEYKPRPGLISQTFTGSSTAIRACSVILEEFTTGGYFGTEGKIAQLHNAVVDRLKAIETAHPDRVRGPYGIGGMIAFTPFDGSLEKVRNTMFKLFENGLIVFITGGEPYRIRMLLPTIGMTLEHVNPIMDILEQTLDQLS